jgi:hypothetical protein
MAERAREEAEAILRPYFAALAERPDERWGPWRKLQFYSRQADVAEKLLNRVEGCPVARTRREVEDSDVLMPELESLPAPVVERLLIAALVGPPRPVTETGVSVTDAARQTPESASANSAARLDRAARRTLGSPQS